MHSLCGACSYCAYHLLRPIHKNRLLNIKQVCATFRARCIWSTTALGCEAVFSNIRSCNRTALGPSYGEGQIDKSALNHSPSAAKWGVNGVLLFRPLWTLCPLTPFWLQRGGLNVDFTYVTCLSTRTFTSTVKNGKRMPHEQCQGN